MSPSSPENRLETFETHRRSLVTLAYRMLGDMGRAEDAVQEAWLRWDGHAVDAISPKAYLVTIVTRLCLTELDSARARREESRADRLPEPIALDGIAVTPVEKAEEVSMALLVILQRLKPAERAVLLLHDVFDVPHDEIGALLGKSVAACRKLLERGRQSVAEERRVMSASNDEHRRLLRAFLAAASAGDVNVLATVLAEDAVMISDGGADGVVTGGFRNLPRPLHGGHASPSSSPPRRRATPARCASKSGCSTENRPSSSGAATRRSARCSSRPPVARFTVSSSTRIRRDCRDSATRAATRRSRLTKTSRRDELRRCSGYRRSR